MARIPDAVRRAVAERYGCGPNATVDAARAYCGAPGTVHRPNRSWACFVLLELDHIVPQALGGDHSPANLTLACRPCNRRKKDQIWELRHGAD